MNPQPNLASSQDAPPVDFLKAVRQYDEPLVALAPYQNWSHYRIWRSWVLDALQGSQALQESLHKSAIDAFRESGNIDPPAPFWPVSACVGIDQKLLSIQAQKYLLSTSAGIYLFISCEKAAARRWPA